jgi:FkbM family methyltransferase
MIKKFKQKIKEFDTWFWNIFFRHVKAFPALKYYPKGRNHLYDILIEEKRNDNFIIFDVGANIGQTAKFYNSLLSKPQIYSFEPVLSTFNKLKVNIKESNISCFNYALGAKKEKVEIKVTNESLNNSLVSEVNLMRQTNKTEIVDVETVDGVFKEHNLNKIDVLKIDTEGYEMEVLKGARKILSNKKVKYVFCEVGFNNEPDKGDFCKISEFLRNYNFKLCGFYDTNKWGENFMYIKYVNALFKLVEECCINAGC